MSLLVSLEIIWMEKYQKRMVQPDPVTGEIIPKLNILKQNATSHKEDMNEYHDNYIAINESKIVEKLKRRKGIISKFDQSVNLIIYANHIPLETFW